MPSSINLLFLKSDLLPSYKMKKKSNSSKISTHILIWLVGTYLLPSYKMKKKSNSSKISTHILIWLVCTYLLPSYKMKKKVKFFKNFFKFDVVHPTFV